MTYAENFGTCRLRGDGMKTGVYDRAEIVYGRGCRRVVMEDGKERQVRETGVGDKKCKMQGV